MPLSSGQVLNNRYRITNLLGQGNAGAVYSAWDLTLNSPVALKEYRGASPQYAGQPAYSAQFALQARLLANLRHENLPYVIDHFDQPDGGQYLIMELVDGQDLQTLINRSGGRGLPEPQALACIHEVCNGLSYLHSQSPPIIHRDVKPANIKITPKNQVILVDFGFPKTNDSAATDPRSDIFDLGATLYAALTARPKPDIRQLRAGQRLQPPRQINPAITPAVEYAILRATEPAPEKRFQTVDEFKQALPPAPPLSIGRSPAPEYPVPAATSARTASRNWMVWGLIALAVLCLGVILVGGVGAYLFFSSPVSATSTNVLSLDLAATSTALASQLAPPISTTPAPPLVTSPAPPLPDTPTPTSTLPNIPTATLQDSPTPTPTETSIAKSTWQPCQGIYSSRLHVGEKASVSEEPPLPNRVRTQPNTDGAVVGFIQPGEQVDILEGPICSNQWIWWRVRSLTTGLAGWTAEGDASGYWLVPVP